MKRMIDTGTWDDPWFAELQPDTKLVFLYLLTNRRSTAAGAFEITARAMSFETGIESKRIGEILTELSSRITWWDTHKVIWIHNFFKHQSANENFHKSAQFTVADMPTEVQCAIGVMYPSLVPEGVDCADITGKDTHGNGLPTGKDTHDAVLELELELDIEESSGIDTPFPPTGESATPMGSVNESKFSEFWQAYPKKVAKDAAERAFKKINWRKVYFADVMSSLEAQKQSEQWTKDNGKFVPNGGTWLNGKRWEDEVRPAASTSNPQSPQGMSTAQRLAEQAKREKAEYEQARSNGSSGGTGDGMAGETDNRRNESGLFLVAGRRTG